MKKLLVSIILIGTLALESTLPEEWFDNLQPCNLDPSTSFARWHRNKHIHIWNALEDNIPLATQKDILKKFWDYLSLKRYTKNLAIKKVIFHIQPLRNYSSEVSSKDFYSSASIEGKCLLTNTDKIIEITQQIKIERFMIQEKYFNGRVVNTTFLPYPPISHE